MSDHYPDSVTSWENESAKQDRERDMNPTTQLVEAIERALLDARNYDRTDTGVALMQARLPSAKTIPEANRAVLLAIADAVDAEIGEDCVLPRFSSVVGRRGSESQYYHNKGINATNARMRAFTTGLREAAKID